MGKPRADGQEPDRRPTRRVEVAQHTEGGWYARGGKFGGSAVEQRAITWGGLLWDTSAGVSRTERSEIASQRLPRRGERREAARSNP